MYPPGSLGVESLLSGESVTTLCSLPAAGRPPRHGLAVFAQAFLTVGELEVDKVRLKERAQRLARAV